MATSTQIATISPPQDQNRRYTRSRDVISHPQRYRNESPPPTVIKKSYILRPDLAIQKINAACNRDPIGNLVQSSNTEGSIDFSPNAFIAAALLLFKVLCTPCKKIKNKNLSSTM